jgi:hypothetical protein
MPSICGIRCPVVSGQDDAHIRRSERCAITGSKNPMTMIAQHPFQGDADIDYHQSLNICHDPTPFRVPVLYAFTKRKVDVPLSMFTIAQG